jgi:hypothetical protein
MSSTLTTLARHLTPKPFRKLLLEDLIAALPAEEQDYLRADAAASPTPYMPTLEYTEAKPEWIALYMHCSRGQIDPSVLRRMRDIDLEYLAASPPPADFYRLAVDDASREQRRGIELQIDKLHANTTRATRELQRRYAFRIGSALAALGVALGATTSHLF